MFSLLQWGFLKEKELFLVAATTRGNKRLYKSIYLELSNSDGKMGSCMKYVHEENSKIMYELIDVWFGLLSLRKQLLILMERMITWKVKRWVFLERKQR